MGGSSWTYQPQASRVPFDRQNRNLFTNTGSSYLQQNTRHQTAVNTAINTVINDSFNTTLVNFQPQTTLFNQATHWTGGSAYTDWSRYRQPVHQHHTTVGHYDDYHYDYGHSDNDFPVLGALGIGAGTLLGLGVLNSLNRNQDTEYEVYAETQLKLQQERNQLIRDILASTSASAIPIEASTQTASANATASSSARAATNTNGQANSQAAATATTTTETNGPATSAQANAEATATSRAEDSNHSTLEPTIQDGFGIASFESDPLFKTLDEDVAAFDWKPDPGSSQNLFTAGDLSMVTRFGRMYQYMGDDDVYAMQTQFNLGSADDNNYVYFDARDNTPYRHINGTRTDFSDGDSFTFNDVTFNFNGDTLKVVGDGYEIDLADNSERGGHFNMPRLEITDSSKLTNLYGMLGVSALEGQQYESLVTESTNDAGDTVRKVDNDTLSEYFQTNSLNQSVSDNTLSHEFNGKTGFEHFDLDPNRVIEDDNS